MKVKKNIEETRLKTLKAKELHIRQFSIIMSVVLFVAAYSLKILSASTENLPDLIHYGVFAAAFLFYVSFTGKVLYLLLNLIESYDNFHYKDNKKLQRKKRWGLRESI